MAGGHLNCHATETLVIVLTVVRRALKNPEQCNTSAKDVIYWLTRRLGRDGHDEFSAKTENLMTQR